MEIIDSHTEQLDRICKDFCVKELYVFGSALRNSLNQDSDLDFQVFFGDEIVEGAFDRYMGLKTALEQAFQRKVDLISGDYFRNTVFKESLNSSKVLVYAG